MVDLNYRPGTWFLVFEQCLQPMFVKFLRKYLSMILMLNQYLLNWMRMRERPWPAFVAEANLLCFSFLSSVGTSSLFIALWSGAWAHCLFPTCTMSSAFGFLPVPLSTHNNYSPICALTFSPLHKIMYSSLSRTLKTQNSAVWWSDKLFLAALYEESSNI